MNYIIDKIGNVLQSHLVHFIGTSLILPPSNSIASTPNCCSREVSASPRGSMAATMSWFALLFSRTFLMANIAH